MVVALVWLSQANDQGRFKGGAEGPSPMPPNNNMEYRNVDKQL